jgi:hypothetical protein
MQLMERKESLMRPLSLLPPAVAEDRDLEIDEKGLIGSFEISEEEILEDLLYPAAPRAAGLSGPEAR